MLLQQERAAAQEDRAEQGLGSPLGKHAERAAPGRGTRVTLASVAGRPGLVAVAACLGVDPDATVDVAR